MDDMKNYRWWAQGSRCYERVEVVIDMLNLRSYEHNGLDGMHNSRLWMIWTILGYELKAIDSMNSLGSWMTWMNLGHDL